MTNSILSEETNFAWKYTLTKSKGMKKKIFHENENQNWVWRLISDESYFTFYTYFVKRVGKDHHATVKVSIH